MAARAAYGTVHHPTHGVHLWVQCWDGGRGSGMAWQAEGLGCRSKLDLFGESLNFAIFSLVNGSPGKLRPN